MPPNPIHPCHPNPQDPITSDLNIDSENHEIVHYLPIQFIIAKNRNCIELEKF